MNNTICKICMKSITHKHLHYMHNIDAKTYYDTYIKKPTEGTCICGNYTKYADMTQGYKKYCSKRCSAKNIKRPACKSITKKKISLVLKGRTKEQYEYIKASSERMKGLNNPGSLYNRNKNIKKWDNVRTIVSNKIKERIKNGTFTPCITNSWANSRVKLHLNGYGVYRSTWDAAFQILNPTCKYEKIRIPYTFENIEHFYIIDFVDEINHILYEIKPDNCKEIEKNKIKFEHAKKWAIENKYKYVIISNDWFKENARKIDYTKYDKKLYLGMKQFNEN